MDRSCLDYMIWYSKENDRVPCRYLLFALGAPVNTTKIYLRDPPNVKIVPCVLIWESKENPREDFLCSANSIPQGKNEEKDSGIPLLSQINNLRQDRGKRKTII